MSGGTRHGCCTTTLLTRRPRPCIFGEARDDCHTLQISPLQHFSSRGLKFTLIGRQFRSTEEIEENSLWDLTRYPAERVPELETSGKRCMDSRGEYFEGDKSC
jgi:hypothetical protein